MKIAVVEDDDFKCKWIVEAIKRYAPHATIIVGRSVNSGLAVVEANRPDLLVLDMSLTTFDVGPSDTGGRPQNFGGVELLRHLDRLEIRVPTIIITQYSRFDDGTGTLTLEEIRVQLQRQFGDLILDVIHYNSTQGKWRTLLGRLIREHMNEGGK